MKKFILCIALAFSSYVSAQVGINTDLPKATLDISANPDGTIGVPSGLLIPRITRAQAGAVSSNSITTPVESTLIYINNLDGMQDGAASEIDAKGFYYYSAVKQKWTKIVNNPEGTSNFDFDNGLSPTTSPNITTVRLGGELKIPTTIITTTGDNNTINNLAISGDVKNAFSVDGATFSVDGATNNVGIGTTSPDTKLHINNGTTAGAIKIQDGTQANGKVLTSDTNGVGTWKSLPTVTPDIFTNGITKTGSTVKLGGNLIEPTTIKVTSGNENLNNLTISTTVSNNDAAVFVVDNNRNNNTNDKLVKFRTLPNTNPDNENDTSTSTSVPVYIDSDGILRKQNSLVNSANNSYSVNKSISNIPIQSATYTDPTVLFNNVTVTSVVNFDFYTNLVMGESSGPLSGAGLIYCELSFSIRNGFKVTECNNSGSTINTFGQLYIGETHTDNANSTPIISKLMLGVGRSDSFDLNDLSNPDNYKNSIELSHSTENNNIELRYFSTAHTNPSSLTFTIMNGLKMR